MSSVVNEQNQTVRGKCLFKKQVKNPTDYNIKHFFTLTTLI